MRREVVALLASAAVLCGSEAAVAHDISTPTTVVITGSESLPAGTLAVSGYLSTSKACRSDRPVDIFARYGEWTPRRHVWGPGDWKLADEVRSRADGSFAGAVAEPGLWSTKVVVTRTDLGRRGHRHVCGRDTEGLKQRARPAR